MSIEADIQKAIRNNDQKEYSLLIGKVFQDISPELLAFNLKLAPKDIVEDAITMVFIMILEDPKKILNARSIKKYLHKMVTNTIVDRLRAERGECTTNRGRGTMGLAGPGRFHQGRRKRNTFRRKGNTL